MHNYLCDGYNVILLRLTHRGQITISIDICYKLLHQLLCSSIVIPFAQNPQDLRKEKKKKKQDFSPEPASTGGYFDFLPQWYFLELQVIYCLHGDL